MTSQIKAAHTPGPAHVEGRAGYTGHSVKSVDGRSVASFPSTSKRPKEERDANARLIAEAFTVADETGLTPRQLVEQRDALLAALKTGADNIEHMAAWIAEQNAGYSFECLGEDMPGIRSAIAAAKAVQS